jgi:uncharacterized protein (TIGR00369 family)
MTRKTLCLPAGLRHWLLTRFFGRAVPFIATAGVDFQRVEADCVEVRLRNRHKVQNHIKGVHAAATALLAETASGFVMALNVPDDKLLLLKSMRVDYLQRSQGNLRAQARLSPQQIELLHLEPKGNLLVAVLVSDDSDSAPVACEMTWAWISKQRRGEDHGQS